MKQFLLTWFLVGALLLPTVSCRKSEEQGRVLSEKEFCRVLTDVYLTDAMLTTLDSGNKSRWQRGMKSNLFQDAAYRWVLDKHGISEDDFYASVNHYMRYSKRANPVFDEVKASLEKMRKSVEAKEALRVKREEQLAYERKWKAVHIDSAYIAGWGTLLTMDTLSLSALDSVNAWLSERSDICPDETTPAYWDSVRLAEKIIADSLRLDSIRLDSTRLDSIRLDSLNPDSTALDSLAPVSTADGV